MKRYLKCQRGFSLIETVVASGVGAMTIFLMSAGFNSANRWHLGLQSKTDSLVLMQRSILEISKYGMFSDGCSAQRIPIEVIADVERNAEIVSLDCQVQFPNGSVEKISYVYHPKEQSLTYRRNYAVVWRQAATGFDLCRGIDCFSSGEIPSGINLDNYFRFRITLLHANGDSLTVRSAFFPRNSRPPLEGFRYLAMPGGMP